jgi:hypothetical protein
VVSLALNHRLILKTGMKVSSLRNSAGLYTEICRQTVCG